MGFCFFFLSHMAQHLVSMRPDSLDAVSEAARMAELTNITKSATEVLTELLADVQIEQFLTDSNRPEDLHHLVERLLSCRHANSHQFQVVAIMITILQLITLLDQHLLETEQFKDLIRVPGSPSPIGPLFTPSQMQAPENSPTRFRTPSGPNQCPKCGRSPHQNFNQCPAINTFCALCSRRGHFIAVSRLAQRTRQIQQFNE